MSKNAKKVSFAFIARIALLLLAAATAGITTLLSPVSEFPVNTYISEICVVFSLMLITGGFEDLGLYERAKRLLKTLPVWLIITLTAVSAIITGVLCTPLAALMLLLPLIKKLLPKKKPDIVSDKHPIPPIMPVEPITLLVYIIAFILAVLTLYGVLDTIVVFVSVLLTVVILDPQNFREADYGLLLILLLLSVTEWNITRTGMIPITDTGINAVILSIIALKSLLN